MAMFMKYSGYLGRFGLAVIELILGAEAHARRSALEQALRDNLVAKLKQPGDGASRARLGVSS
jgi:hypothetical protein